MMAEVSLTWGVYYTNIFNYQAPRAVPATMLGSSLWPLEALDLNSWGRIAEEHLSQDWMSQKASWRKWNLSKKLEHACI